LALEKYGTGGSFIELQSVDSTNNYAMRQVHAGVARHGFTVFAHEQTAGKGQRNKLWLAERGTNILMSVVIEPAPLFATPSFLFSMAMAVAAHGLLKKLAGNGITIKWPNDLYFRDRKAGGILIENILGSGIWKFAVTGIGLNINQMDFGALENKAISLKQLTGTHYDTIALAKELCFGIDAVLKKLETDTESVTDQYHQHLYKRGEWVKLKQGPRVFEAVVKGVNTAGQLITHHAVEEAFDVGEVEWVL
jgi:BirA family biotin operon repressor/biotin-[acetyl-CoA-carboxylase] ligase